MKSWRRLVHDPTRRMAVRRGDQTALLQDHEGHAGVGHTARPSPLVFVQNKFIISGRENLLH